MYARNGKRPPGGWRRLASLDDLKAGTQLGGRYKITRCPYTQDESLSIKWNETEKAEQEANALLISKAPELLAFIQKYYRYLNISDQQEAENLIRSCTK